MGRAAHLLACLIVAVACGKELNPKFCAAHPDDERCAGTLDATLDSPAGSDVAHLPPQVEAMLTSTAEVSISEPTTIDTATGEITPALPPDVVVLPSVPQDTGPDVMVIQAASFTTSARIEVVGDRPLVIVATRTIELGMRLNISAVLATPGPGGALPGEGPGAGEDAPGSGQGSADPGGGGGSYGTAGGRGGDVANGPSGGAPGAIYATPLSLVGGSGGGFPSKPGSCVVSPGAGGGAVQLTAFESITILLEGIRASGGGGGGGDGCGSHGSGGAGGGAGGMIFLQAPLLLGDARVSANGGGGGEGAAAGGASNGGAGSDGSLSSGGGAGGSAGIDGGDGGRGGDGNNPGAPGGDVQETYNGGGGGGGVGAIYYLTTGDAPAYTASPPATVL